MVNEDLVANALPIRSTLGVLEGAIKVYVPLRIHCA